MNFALILFILMIITGICWLADKCIFAKKRLKKVQILLSGLEENFAKNLANTSSNNSDNYSAEEISKLNLARQEIKIKTLRLPWYLEYSAGLFPVIAFVFLMRSFLVEPFKIPSGSMIPTLLIGDFILVNKFTYGIRLPIINKKIFNMNEPKKGDVMVFRYPKDLSLDYIKRVVGVPGDIVFYENKRLNINGVDLDYKSLPDYLDETKLSYSRHFSEQIKIAPGAISNKEHRILNDADRELNMLRHDAFSYQENCTYTENSMRCTVPAGHYFMMGDNRDNSADSRYWGFVPEENIVGRAFFVWMNLSNIKRIGPIE